MPYIKNDDNRREALIKGEIARNAAELNFKIFHLVKYWDFRKYKGDLISKIRGFVVGFMGKRPNYQKYNDMTGCLIRCYKEIYRRLQIDLELEFERILKMHDTEIAKYEDEKLKENGDV